MRLIGLEAGFRSVRRLWRFFAAAVLAASLASGGMAQSGDVRPLLSATPDAAATPRIVYPAQRLPALVLPDGRKRLVRSILNTPGRMEYGDFAWDDRGIADGPTWVRVDLARQTLSVFRAGHEIGTAVILFGADNKPTPAGVFPVLAKAKQHRSSLYDAEMPFMLRLTGDGIAIHASSVFKGAVTHGCIGIPIGFARRLYEAMRVGDEVAIVGRQTR